MIAGFADVAVASFFLASLDLRYWRVNAHPEGVTQDGALTGSNAASNALFMPLQVEAARNLGISEAFTAAGQNVSGSHASLLAPQRVILAATSTGLLGREGDIVRAALPPVLASVVVLGVAGLVVS